MSNVFVNCNFIFLMHWFEYECPISDLYCNWIYRLKNSYVGQHKGLLNHKQLLIHQPFFFHVSCSIMLKGNTKIEVHLNDSGVVVIITAIMSQFHAQDGDVSVSIAFVPKSKSVHTIQSMSRHRFLEGVNCIFCKNQTSRRSKPSSYEKIIIAFQAVKLAPY